MLTVDNSSIRVCIRKFCSSGAFGWEEQVGSVSSFHPGSFLSFRFFYYVVLGMFYYYYYFVFGSECFLRAKTVGPPGTVKGQARSGQRRIRRQIL